MDLKPHRRRASRDVDSSSLTPDCMFVAMYFLIFRKRKVIFLHWYHHCTVLLFTWFFYHEFFPGTLWYGSMNYTVHSIMYTYYTIMATKLVRFPKFISISITSIQIVQMILGIWVQFILWLRKDQEDCKSSDFFVYSGLVIYGSYFVLFMKFFISTYVKKTKKLD